ncbi:unnamed protein product [Acanthoscelides obtectus]|uniref:Tyr recombinase domain-containing protein n=1 Tax=Acanthoscelides obtectus TaxID=200917 RepID=A0A9P0LR20_ACAOB|nr:unnamed protein product [Acanthoscelides obtectus]CAK1648263.1 hypothetical protein AOBTE_LOCUS15624 [Acanthoscelides obtectus]
MYAATIPSVLTFLTLQFNRGCSFSSLNSYRAAISQILGPNLSDDFRIKRLFKGLSSLRPPLPKYNKTWDPAIVLDYIKRLSQSPLNLENLTYKTAMLIALATGQRVQTLASININDIHVFPDKLELVIKKKLKTSNINRTQHVLVLPFYTSDINICPAKSLLSYIEKTKEIRNSTSALFLTFKKPHRAATTQSISRWLKGVLNRSGVDTDVFSAHSTRHASTSAADRKGVSYDTIRTAAGWTEKSKTFAVFYKKPLLSKELDFANAVLDS